MHPDFWAPEAPVLRTLPDLVLHTSSSDCSPETVTTLLIGYTQTQNKLCFFFNVVHSYSRILHVCVLSL